MRRKGTRFVSNQFTFYVTLGITCKVDSEIENSLTENDTSGDGAQTRHVQSATQPAGDASTSSLISTADNHSSATIIAAHRRSLGIHTMPAAASSEVLIGHSAGGSLAERRLRDPPPRLSSLRSTSRTNSQISALGPPPPDNLPRTPTPIRAYRRQSRPLPAPPRSSDDIAVDIKSTAAVENG